MREPIPPAPLRPFRVVCLALYLGACFGAAAIDFARRAPSTLPDHIVEEQNAEASAESHESGNTVRKIAYVAIAALGPLGLLVAGMGGLGPRASVFLAPAAFYLFATASVFWADSTGICARRLVAIGFAILGSYGVSRLCSVREIGVVFSLVAMGLLLIGVVGEAATNGFNPLRSGYRFTGGQHPNSQALLQAFGLMGAVFFLGRTRWQIVLKLSIIVLGVTFLVLTKSRTTTGTLLLVLTSASCLRYGLRAVPGVVFVGSGAVGVVLLAIGLTTGGGSAASEVATMGRGRDVASLTGRIPTWTILLREGSEHPVLGAGYGSFWNGESVPRISHRAGWALDHAHSIYIESFLQLGVLGTLLVVLTMVVALWNAFAAYRQSRSTAHLYLFSLFLFGAVHGMAETDFLLRGLPYFVFIAGLFYLGQEPAAVTRPVADAARRSAAGSAIRLSRHGGHA